VQWLGEKRGGLAPDASWEAFGGANPDAAKSLEKDAKRLIYLSFSQPWRAEDIPPLEQSISQIVHEK
jgi:hypothetical protein